MSIATAMPTIGTRERKCEFNFAILCSRCCAMLNKTTVQTSVTAQMIKSFGYSVLCKMCTKYRLIAESLATHFSSEITQILTILRKTSAIKHISGSFNFTVKTVMSYHPRLPPRDYASLHYTNLVKFTNLPNQNENNDCTKKVVGLIINKVVNHSVIHSIPVM